MQLVARLLRAYSRGGRPDLSGSLPKELFYAHGGRGGLLALKADQCRAVVLIRERELRQTTGQQDAADERDHREHVLTEDLPAVRATVHRINSVACCSVACGN